MTNTKEILDKYNAMLQQSFAKAMDQQSLGDVVVAMSREIPSISSKSIEIGDIYTLADVKAGNATDAQIDAYIVHHHWADAVKEMCVLWRNSTLEVAKAAQYLEEGRINHIDGVKLIDQTRQTLQQAITDVTTVFDREKEKLGTDNSQVSRTIYNEAKQIDAWPIYRQQLKDVSEQTRKVANASTQLKRSHTTYKTVLRILKNYTAKRKENMKSLEQYGVTAKKTVQSLHADSEEQDFNKTIQTIDKIQSTLNALSIEHSHLDQVEKILGEKSDTLEVPVSYENGKLYSKEVNVSKNTQEWLRTELFFKYVELEEIESQVKNNLKMTLINLKNRLIMMRNKVADAQPEGLQSVLNTFEDAYDKAHRKHSKIVKRSKKVLKQNFFVSEIFNPNHEFLPVSRQSTFDSIEVGSVKVRDRVSGWVSENFASIGEVVTNADKEKKLSSQEKAIRYVESRELQNIDNQYASVFLVKGYIGESFVIGRADELDRLNNIYSRWQNGFPGAVLVTGQRFSGKTLFLEYANLKSMSGKAIRLMPHQEYEVQGRVYKAGADLGEVLSKITQFASSKPAVIIDDIERWHSKDNTIAGNLRKLCEVIDKYSNKIFFAVSMSNWLKQKMENLYGLSKVFVGEINLDNMSLAEIRQVISVRQNATHRKLVDVENNTLEAEAFDRITKKIYHAADGNVGDSLFRWLLQVDTSQNNVKVTQHETYELPEVEDTLTMMLLESIIMSRKTNNQILVKQFGPAFKTKFASRLQRLISMGLVTRDIDGLIQISPAAINDIGRALERQGYIKYASNV